MEVSDGAPPRATTVEHVHAHPDIYEYVRVTPPALLVWLTQEFHVSGKPFPPRIVPNWRRIFPITFDDFHLLGIFLRFVLTVFRVLSRRLLISRDRHS